MISRLKDKDFRRSLYTVLKFIIAIVFTCLTYSTTKNATYIVVGLIELVLVFLIYNLIIDRHKFLQFCGNMLYFVYLAQMAVLYFGNSFTTLAMIKNIKFLKDLGGQAVTYILGTVLVLFFVFLPGKAVVKTRKVFALVLVVLIVGEIFINMDYKRFSPLQSFGSLFTEELRYQHVKRAAADPQLALNTFHNDGLTDAVAKPSNLSEKPNIIVIFTEGLSYNIIADEEKDIMPNVREFEKSCITFKNYYNHTFPTLRGVQGQLYSGYKFDDDKQGNNLVSVQSVLKVQGYRTAFINTEPFNDEFTKYLNNLGFDEIIDDEDNVSGLADGMTDGEAYRLLMDSAHDLAKDKDQPFMLGIYTFGTHVSFDSREYQYGDGANGFLNKFYNCDQMFKYFLDDFKSSELADNTILIFTTDHSTYADQSYTDVFTDYKRNCTDCDVMPLFIYYDGIEPQEIDADGRNSLCFAPTVLDFLDLDAENYFLGSSLFDPDGSTTFDRMFYDAAFMISTKNNEVRYLDNTEIEDLVSHVLPYFSAVEAERK